MDTVLAAIDLGPSSGRVLYHAAGFARLLSLKLRVLHVTRDTPPAGEQDRVREFCRSHGPYEVNFDEIDIAVAGGLVSEAIVREAIREKARLVVVGSRGHSGMTRVILGSTSEAVLRAATTAVLVVPPTDFDIVNISDRAALTCGPIVAAVDLENACEHQLGMAAALARAGSQRLLLLTVAPQRVSEHAASHRLRERAHTINDANVHALIVRRGDVAEQISLCARAERSGLVVMGLRPHSRGKPGAIASAVLKTNRAFVLAVPGC
jgi:nucleotide-binding universal stress UspA family protein